MTYLRCFQDAATFSQNHTHHRRQDKTGQNISADEATFNAFFRKLQPINTAKGVKSPLYNIILHYELIKEILKNC